jgi:hypothetical protein
MNMLIKKMLVYSVIIAVIINIILPLIVRPFATPNQIKPPNGAQTLSFFDQLMHMFVHHAQVPLTSSIIVAIIVGLSVFLAHLLHSRII